MKLATRSFRKKFRWLVVSMIPVLWLSYQLAVSKTVSEYRTYQLRQQQASTQSDASGTLEKLERKHKKINELLSHYQLDSVRPAKNLLPVVSELCQDFQLQLKEYKPAGTASVDSMRLFTRMVTVEGGFLDCLHFVYALEQNYQVGRISSVYYKSYSEPQDKTVRLNCTLYIQNVY